MYSCATEKKASTFVDGHSSGSSGFLCNHPKFGSYVRDVSEFVVYHVVVGEVDANAVTGGNVVGICWLYSNARLPA